MKKKNKKGQGRKSDPSKNVTIRIKIDKYDLLKEKYGSELTNVLRAAILNCISP